MSLFDQISQFTVTGLINGSIYALIAVGFVTVYNVTGILNFAQGEFAMLGAMVAAGAHGAGLPLPLAVLLAVAAAAAVAGLMDRLAIHPARKAGPLTLIIITLGVAIAIRGTALLIWGTEGRRPPAWLPGDPLQVLGASMQRQGLVAILLSLVMVGVLYQFFNRTTLGIAVRASVNNRLAARLSGVSPNRMSLLAFAISGGAGGLAGALVAPIQTAVYDMGVMLGLKGFVAAVLGGINNAPAAVVGGYVLGMLEFWAAGMLSSAYKDAIAFLLLLIILVVRPTGILGRVGGKRV